MRDTLPMKGFVLTRTTNGTYGNQDFKRIIETTTNVLLDSKKISWSDQGMRTCNLRDSFACKLIGYFSRRDTITRDAQTFDERKRDGTKVLGSGDGLCDVTSGRRWT